MATHRTVIRAHHITQHFRIGSELITPIKDASFTLLEGSFNIIYGPSGSGKSTLLNILTGLQPPTKGRVWFDDRDVYKLSPDELALFRATRLGIIYQNNYWVRSLNVIENVCMPLFFLGYTRARALETAQFALSEVGMADHAHKFPQLLSGGEQQRIAVARALVSSPLYIVADEPTGSLDSASGDMVVSLLQRVQRDNNRTIIMVTHNLEYLSLAEHLLHIKDGRVSVLPHNAIQKTAKDVLTTLEQRIDRLAVTGQAGDAVAAQPEIAPKPEAKK